MRLIVNCEISFRGILWNAPWYLTFLLSEGDKRNYLLYDLLLQTERVVISQTGYDDEIGRGYELDFLSKEGNLLQKEYGAAHSVSLEDAGCRNLFFYENPVFSEEFLVNLAKQGNQVAEHMLRRRSIPPELWEKYQYVFPSPELLPAYTWEYPISEEQKQEIKLLLENKQ